MATPERKGATETLLLSGEAQRRIEGFKNCQKGRHLMVIAPSGVEKWCEFCNKYELEGTT